MPDFPPPTTPVQATPSSPATADLAAKALAGSDINGGSLSKTDSMPMDDETGGPAKTKKERFRGYVIYGLRQTFFCFITDVIDPVVGGWFQDLFGAGGRVHKWMEKGGSTQSSLMKNGKIASWVNDAGTVKEARTKLLSEELGENKALQELLQTEVQTTGGKKIDSEATALNTKQKLQGILESEGRPEAAAIETRNPEKKQLSKFQHALRGEVVGDILALGVYLGAKYFLMKPLDKIIAKVQKRQERHSPDMGKVELREWAEKHGISEDDPRYVKRLEEFRHTKAEGKVDSAIIAGSSLVLNVAAQKLGGNTAHWSVVAGGKLIGTAATLGVMLGLDAIVPRTMRTFDHEVDKKYFEPGVNWFKRKFGKTEETSAAEKPAPAETASLSIDLTPDERARLNLKPKTDFRERSFAQQLAEAHPVHMTM